jgi:peptide deformylase
MALRRIVMSNEDALRKKSREITVFDDKLWVLLDDMYETMSQYDGVGLAAPQVGILRRAVVIEDDDIKYEFINPVITSSKGNQSEVEGCLSSPGDWGYVKRPDTIHVKAFNRHGREFNLDAEGVFAIAICHEIDHLDGVLFTDLAYEMVDDEAELEKAKRQRNRKKKKRKRQR